MNSFGITSPKGRGPKKAKRRHLPRKERPCAGELVQLDASEHDWLMDAGKITLHGAVDDATHAPLGLYFCANECRLGYGEVMRQILTTQGKPEAVYIDRHAAFVKNARKEGKTQEERFAVPPQDEKSHFKPANLTDDGLEGLLSVKFRKRTRWNGEFVFHGFLFRLEAARAACRDFTLCLSERTGIRAYMDGRFYPVALSEPLADCAGDTMPQVEKDLAARYLLKSERGQYYPFGAAV